jgi:hypothetical protein
MKRSAGIRRGVLTGLATGVVFAIWAFIAYAQHGSAPFDATHTTVGRLALTYLIIGLVGGALVGVTWSRARSAAACYVGAVPAAAAVSLGIILMDGASWTAWEFEEWSLLGVLVVVGTLVIGNQLNLSRVARAQSGRTGG